MLLNQHVSSPLPEMPLLSTSWTGLSAEIEQIWRQSLADHECDKWVRFVKVQQSRALASSDHCECKIYSQVSSWATQPATTRSSQTELKTKTHTDAHTYTHAHAHAHTHTHTRARARALTHIHTHPKIYPFFSQKLHEKRIICLQCLDMPCNHDIVFSQKNLWTLNPHPPTV